MANLISISLLFQLTLINIGYASQDKINQDVQFSGLEKKCEELTEGTIYEYVPIFARVLTGRIYPWEICRHGDCKNAKYAYIYVLEPLEPTVMKSPSFVVYSEAGVLSAFREIEKLFEMYKNYGFCARSTKYFDFLPPNKTSEKRPIFKLDQPQSIMMLE